MQNCFYINIYIYHQLPTVPTGLVVISFLRLRLCIKLAIQMLCEVMSLNIRFQLFLWRLEFLWNVEIRMKTADTFRGVECSGGEERGKTREVYSLFLWVFFKSIRWLLKTEFSCFSEFLVKNFRSFRSGGKALGLWTSRSLNMNYE